MVSDRVAASVLIENCLNQGVHPKICGQFVERICSTSQWGASNE